MARSGRETGRRERRPRRLFGFVRNRSGTAAVELAIVAAPFFALLIAILEVGLVFFAQQDLQTATTQAARLIMTGQAQNENLTQGEFVQQVCNNAAIFTCGGLYANVQVYNSFQSVALSSPVSSGQFSSAGFQYNMGGPGDIVVVQVFYLWPVLGGPLNFNLANANGSYHLLVGTSAFRVEPYQ